MESIIRLSKKVTINQTVNDTKQKNVFDKLVSEIQALIQGHNVSGAVWELHKNRNSAIYHMLTKGINQYTQGLFNVNQGFDISLTSRHNKEIPLELYMVSIDDYDFINNVTFSFYFKTIEFRIVEKISYALVLKGNDEASQIFVIDFDDKSMSIIEHSQK
jgi:hypothetical protein